ncbi:hypothetical protein T11_1245 [Trichinella zimbabwensis]|uniref:Uncharacterized protein n=1 Tax=Trichinella zimbabwensis TaxID=268475 RepID=A0A0V1HDY0_9BILA|nr:hypothetical protein T11_1245 [Trichinella zimbabwensis]
MMNAELSEIEMRPLQLMHRSENDSGIEYYIETCSISENRKVEKCESDFPTLCFLAIPLLALNVAVVLIIVMLSDTNFDFGVNLPTELELVEQKSINPYINLTAHGYFHLRDHNNKVLQKLQSSWLQDDLNKRLKITIGRINSKSWLCDYYFFENETFIVLPLENESKPPSAVCNHVPNWGYQNEMERYRTSAAYAGRRFFRENENTTRLVHVVVGKLNRTNGVEIVERIIDADSFLFIGLRRIPLQPTFYAYMDYWYGDEFSGKMPANHNFRLPSICLRQRSFGLIRRKLNHSEQVQFEQKKNSS